MAISGTPAAILGAANLDEFRGLVHSVGPFGLRVGFAFQQERALNIIASLKLENRLSNNPKIAILGGGLAGMTAYIALHGLGFTNTQLFEINDGVIRVQHDAHHRPVHPCYNNWPTVDFFDATTNFPFFNWFADSAKGVSDALQYRWFNHYSDTFRPIHFQHKVSDLVLIEDDQGLPKEIKLGLKKKDPESNLWVDIEDQHFDRVIIATGFGKESNLDISHCNSYWTPDEINTLREEDENTSIYISGTGDGGLMDSVRFCFRETEKSNLLVRLISYLRHPKYYKALEEIQDVNFEQSKIELEIREFEAKALTYLPDSPDPNMEKFGSRWEIQISEFLKEKYDAIIPQLPAGAQKILESLLFPGWKKIRLIGRTPTPFSCATAPINKLIIAYLMSRNENFYVQGFVHKNQEHPILLLPDGTEQNIEGDILVVRHGANPPVYNFSPNFKVRNASLHNSLANLTDFGREDINLCEYIKGIAECDPKDKNYIETRLKIAVEFGMEYLGVAVYKSVDKIKHGDPPYLEFNRTQEEYLLSKDESIRRSGGHPHDIFGIRLVGVEPQHALSATGIKQ